MAAVLDEPMAEIDMERSPEGDIGSAAHVQDLPSPSTEASDETGVAIRRAAVFRPFVWRAVTRSPCGISAK